MNFRHDPEVDVAYIQLSKEAAVESEEIEEGVVVDYGKNEEAVGVEIQHFGSRFFSIFEATKDEKLRKILGQVA